MDDNTRPTPRPKNSDTAPRRPVARPTPPPRATTLRRRASAGPFRFVLPILAGVVFLNLCATVAFGLYYGQSRADAIASNETPPSPVEAIATLLPQPDNGEPTATPTPGPTPTPVVPDGVYYFLALGIDARADQLAADEPVRTDTMMVARVDFNNRTVRLLSFPRDLWLPMPPAIANSGTNVARINQGYFYGQVYDIPGGGPQGAMDTVTLNFGIPLHGYALVNFQGFVQGVDALGGIDVFVDEAIYDPIYPTDDYGTMELYIPAGWNHFDGAMALRYARTRHQDSDVNRTRRQQQVVLAIVDSALRVDAVTRLPDLWQALEGNYQTSLTLQDATNYAFAFRGIDPASIETYSFNASTMLIGWTTPGRANVWIPRREAIAPMIAEFMRD